MATVVSLVSCSSRMAPGFMADSILFSRRSWFLMTVSYERIDHPIDINPPDHHGFFQIGIGYPIGRSEKPGYKTGNILNQLIHL